MRQPFDGRIIDIRADVGRDLADRRVLGLITAAAFGTYKVFEPHNLAIGFIQPRQEGFQPVVSPDVGQTCKQFGTGRDHRKQARIVVRQLGQNRVQRVRQVHARDIIHVRHRNIAGIAYHQENAALQITRDSRNIFGPWEMRGDDLPPPNRAQLAFDTGQGFVYVIAPSVHRVWHHAQQPRQQIGARLGRGIRQNTRAGFQQVLFFGRAGPNVAHQGVLPAFQNSTAGLAQAVFGTGQRHDVFPLQLLRRTS